MGSEREKDSAYRLTQTQEDIWRSRAGRQGYRILVQYHRRATSDLHALLRASPRRCDSTCTPTSHESKFRGTRTMSVPNKPKWLEKEQIDAYVDLSMQELEGMLKKLHDSLDDIKMVAKRKTCNTCKHGFALVQPEEVKENSRYCGRWSCLGQDVLIHPHKSVACSFYAEPEHCWVCGKREELNSEICDGRCAECYDKGRY